MRVLLINRNSTVEGGADRVFDNTVKGVKGKRVKGGIVEVETFTRDDLNQRQVDPRNLSFVGKIKHASQYFYHREVARELDRKVREFRPDVAHVHLIFGTLSLSVLRVLRKHRVPVVMTVHDYRLVCPANAMLDRHGKICERCAGGKYYHCLLHRCADGNAFYSLVIMLEAYLRKWVTRPVMLVDRFIFVSRFARLKHILYDRRFEGKSGLLYNMAEVRTEPQVMRGGYYLYYGRLSGEKGIRTLMEAFKVTCYELRVAGNGPFLTRNPQPVTRNINILGFKQGAELEEIVKECSFVVLPSEWYENNPMTIVEAFSFGKPVVGANIGGIPELVNEETGILFESGNVESLVGALKRANEMTDEEYEKMSTACYQFYLDHFEPGKHVEELLEVYDSVIKK